MCGIIGYTGTKEAETGKGSAIKKIIEGLKKLEYRGYDSWGIAVRTDQGIIIRKKVGRIGSIDSNSLGLQDGCNAIGHTRWATTGHVKDNNAHPFRDKDNQFSIVHNGIIENYLELKEELRQDGVAFTSDTDSEVMVHLIAKYYQENSNFKEAVLKTIARLQGAYAFGVIKNDSDEIIGGRNGSPLVVGVGDNENFFASDVSAIMEHTRRVIYLNDFQIARLTPGEVTVYDFQGIRVPYEIKEVNWNLEQAQKQGYNHFMLKEIFEQPQVVQESLSAPVSINKNVSRIIIVACGTAYYAGLVGKYIIEKTARVPVMVEMASEFRYREPLFSDKDIVMAISQSGETADTLAAIRLAKQGQAKTYGIINVKDSTIAREVDQVFYTRAGPEIGVASTKAFMAQVVTLYQIAFSLAGKVLNTEGLLPALRQTLALSSSIRNLAQKYFQYHNFLYIGRKAQYPLALEGALKLKEISYIHAEAYPAGELKHGPLSLVSEEMPTLALCPQDSVYEKTFSNIQEVKARKGKVIALATEGDTAIHTVSDDILYLPQVEEVLYPLITAIPLQLFAYHMADLRGCDIDKPRNLAKSVTVE